MRNSIVDYLGDFRVDESVGYCGFTYYLFKQSVYAYGLQTGAI